MGGFDTLLFTKQNYITFNKNLSQAVQRLLDSRFLHLKFLSFPNSFEKLGKLYVLLILEKVGSIVTALHG